MPERDHEFIEVSIEEFAGKAVPYAIFIRLSSWKYLQIAQPGEGLDNDRLAMYKDKNVRALYLRRDDFTSYVGFRATAPESETPPPVARAPRSVDPETRRRMEDLTTSAAATLELLRGNGLNEVLFEASKQFVESTMSLLADDHVALVLLSALRAQKSTSAAHQHSLAVSLFSVMIGRVLGWKSTQNLFRVGLGGLLHDMGLNSLDDSVLTRPLASLSSNDRKLYEKHPEWGAEILKQMTSVPPEVIAIALQHHEFENGKGYPEGLKGARIHPLAKVVAAADAFCELALPGPAGSPETDYEGALGRLVLSGGYAKDVLEALRRIIKGMDA